MDNEVKHLGIKKTSLPRTGRALDAMSGNVTSPGGGSGGSMGESKPSSLWLADKTKEYLHLNEDGSVSLLENSLAAKGSVVAYATEEHDIVLPTAGYGVLGAVSIIAGSGLIIEPGTGRLKVDESWAGGGGGQTYFAGTGLQLLDYDGKLKNQFAVKFGAIAGTAVEGNDTRVLNGDKAYKATYWGQKINAEGLVTGALTGVITVNNLLHFDSGKLSVATNKADVWLQFSGGNSINGVTGVNAALGNLYLNYANATTNVKVTPTGDILATGNVVAYSTGLADLTGPIAGKNLLGMIKVGQGLTILPDGTLSAAGGGSIGGINITGTGNVLTAVSLSEDKTTLSFVKGLTMPTALKSPFGLTVSLNGTSQGAYDGSAAKSFNITAAGIGAAVSSHTHNYAGSSSVGGAATSALDCTGNAATATRLQTARSINGVSFDGSSRITITASASDVYSWAKASSKPSYSYSEVGALSSSDSRISGWNTAASNSHYHSNKSYLDYIDQDVSITSGPYFMYGLSTGNKNDVWINYSSGNSITGMSRTSVGNLYLNYVDSNKNVRIDADCNIKAFGSIIAYSTGSAAAPFQYWLPSVDSSGNLSWTNSTSTSTPTTRNIRGLQGANGTNGVSADYQWSGTSLRMYSASSGWSSYINLKGATGSTGSTGATGARGATGATGPAGPAWSGGTVYSNITISRSDPGLALTGSSPFINFGSSWKMNNYSGDFRFMYGSETRAYFSYASTGNMWIKGALVQNSDMRLKDKISDFSNVLEKIKLLDVFDYTFKDDTGTDKQLRTGVSAQQLRTVFPQFVFGEETDDSYLSVDYIGLGASVALQGLKELDEKLCTWKSDKDREIEALKKEVNELREQPNNVA